MPKMLCVFNREEHFLSPWTKKSHWFKKKCYTPRMFISYHLITEQKLVLAVHPAWVEGRLEGFEKVEGT